MNSLKYDCDVCGSSDCVEIPNVRQYTAGQAIHVCKGCGLVYCRTRRSPEDLAIYWEEQMYGRERREQIVYDPERPVFAGRRAYAVSFLKKSFGGGLQAKKIFDIGLGEGQFGEQLREAGCAVSGVETSKENSKVLAEKKILHYLGTIEQYDTLSEVKKFEKVDIATIIFVLQNSQSATAMVNAAYNQLKEGGSLFIMMGSRILVPFRKPIGTYFSTLPQDVQPYHFSISTLQHLLAKCGFAITHFNNYWDDELMCVIARKLSRDEKVEKMKDDDQEVLNWFERWHHESEKMVKYIKKIPGVRYHGLPSEHTFYEQWQK
ncbi:MAG: methyltransferase domain-containing protein [Candidatus Omnitrophica bacterium]|nr:methyltransferase domain-containing protein [Candidatus Omnitrophota bacterium]